MGYYKSLYHFIFSNSWSFSSQPYILINSFSISFYVFWSSKIKIYLGDSDATGGKINEKN
jgi:hypothetical protein